MRAVALLPAVALVIGAACGSADLITFTAPLWTLPLLVVAATTAFACGRRLTCAALMATAFAVGGWTLARDAKQKALDTPLRAALDREFGAFAIDTFGPAGRHDPLRFRGIVVEDASASEELTTLRVRVTHIELAHRWQPVDGVVSVSVVRGRPRVVRRPGSASGEASADPAREWLAGRTIEATATFRRPAGYLDEGVPDFERDLALSGTTLFASVKSALLVDVIAHGDPMQEAAARVRQHVRRALEQWVARHDPLSAAIAAAVLIGDRSGLPDDVRLRLQAAGTYHVIAISGGNIAILAGLSFALFFLCGIAGRPAALLTLIVLLAYAEVVTAGASVWRATLMAALYLVARAVDHRSPPWQAMGMAAALVVCANPLDVRDAGFILTFGATAALLEAARRVAADAARPGLRWVVASLVASAAAEIVLLPVSASAFSRVTSAGLVLNLVAVPLMTAVQIAAMVVAAMDRLTIVASLAGWITHLAAHGILWSATLVDAAPWLTARVSPPSSLLMTAYYAALATALLGRRTVRACGVVALVVAAIAISTGVGSLHHTLLPGMLRFTVFDVGQGDAELVELPDGSTLQVDAGGIPFGANAFDVGARVLAPALWARGVRSIDTLLLTHGDPDHIGGARSVIESFGPARVWQGIPVARHMPMRDLLAYAGARRAVVEERRAGEQFQSGPVRIRLLHPPIPDWERPRVRNDDSVVVEMLYGDVAILLTGDISAEVERTLMPQLTPARLRVLKVAHHGSRTSSSAAFLETWRPQIAIISAGRGNSFGHPAPEVMDRLRSVGARIYRTDMNGEVTVETDGSSVTVRTFIGK